MVGKASACAVLVWCGVLTVSPLVPGCVLSTGVCYVCLRVAYGAVWRYRGNDDHEGDSSDTEEDDGGGNLDRMKVNGNATASSLSARVQPAATSKRSSRSVTQETGDTPLPPVRVGDVVLLFTLQEWADVRFVGEFVDKTLQRTDGIRVRMFEELPKPCRSSRGVLLDDMGSREDASTTMVRPPALVCVCVCTRAQDFCHSVPW